VSNNWGAVQFGGFRYKKVGVRNSAVGVPRRICQLLCVTPLFGYVWEDLGDNKPVEDSADETIPFEPRRGILMWLGRVKRND